MRYLPYILRHLRRNWVRTGSTVLAVAVCIFLFATLETVIAAIGAATRSGGDSRLVARHGVSIVFNLPLSYGPEIARIPGVKRVAITNWFGGVLPAEREEQAGANGSPDFSRFFPNLAVDPEPYFAMHPEIQVPPEQMAEFLEDMQGCLVGAELAARYGWKVGDRFFLESFIPPYRKRDGPFRFVVRGIYQVDRIKNPAADAGMMFFQFRYMYEALGQRVSAGMYTVELQDPSRAASVAQAIDAAFENSDAQTKTETESAFRAGFISLAGNLALLIRSIGLAVTFTILLVAANTMSMAVRERRTEIAVLKTLGFTSARVMGLVLAEAIALGALGGLVGLGLAHETIRALPGAPGVGAFLRGFPNFDLHFPTGLLALGMAVFLGFAAGFVPAVLAFRARIAESLRQV